MKLRFPSMLSRASQLENQLDDFFDKVVVATLIFRNSLELYLNPLLSGLKKRKGLESLTSGDYGKIAVVETAFYQPRGQREAY